MNQRIIWSPGRHDSYKYWESMVLTVTTVVMTDWCLRVLLVWRRGTVMWWWLEELWSEVAQADSSHQLYDAGEFSHCDVRLISTVPSLQESCCSNTAVLHICNNITSQFASHGGTELRKNASQTILYLQVHPGPDDGISLFYCQPCHSQLSQCLLSLLCLQCFQGQHQWSSTCVQQFVAILDKIIFKIISI